MVENSGCMKLRRLCFIVFVLFLITACNSSKNISYKSSTYKRNKEVKPPKPSKESNYKIAKEANSVLKEAYKFLGTPYKYGGTTSSGLDCSGLVINAFDAIGFQMPRISRDQATQGKEVRLNDVKEGDLVFFSTSGSKINHVGIVENVKNGEVFFIHSSTSKGVIVSSIEETYWNKRFVKATRVL